MRSLCGRRLNRYNCGCTASRGLAMKPFTLTAVVVLALIALVHLLRLFTGWDVVVTGFAVPVWWSAPVVGIFAGLAFLVWREAEG